MGVFVTLKRSKGKYVFLGVAHAVEKAAALGVRHVRLQLLQRSIVGNLGVRGGRVVAAVRVGEKELPVVFGREVILVAAVVRVGVGG